MVPSRADPRGPLSTASRSPLVSRCSFPSFTFIFIVAVLLASQASLCAADSSDDDLGSVTWTFPRGGEVFHHLDTVNVIYQSSYLEPWLYIWCYQNQTGNTVRFIRKTEVEPYFTSVMIYMNFSSSTPCWFNLRDNTKSSKGLNTEKWSLKQTERQSGPITTGASLPSTTATTTNPSSSTSPASAATFAAAAAAEANRSSSSNGDISAAAKAGLGIGVGIGTGLLCAGAFWLYYRHVKREEHHQEVYRRIMGSGQGGGVGGSTPGHDAFAVDPNNNSEHLEPWRYGGTPQPAPSAVGSTWSGGSDPSTTEWHQGQTTTANASYQYYDPVGSSHQLWAMQGAAGMGAGAAAYHYSQPSVTTTASMAAEPPPSTIAPVNNPHHHPRLHHRADHVPEAAAIRDVQDLSSSLYPSEYNEPVSPVSAAAGRSIPPARVASVNYGPNGPRDASTGADFTLLPDYTSPTGGGGGEEEEDRRRRRRLDEAEEEEDDIYGPPTPRSPPPHSAHAHIGSGQQQQQQPRSGHTAGAVELPTAQTHHRGYGPQAELPADVAGAVQPPLGQQQQQRSGLRGTEQKVLLRDVAALRKGPP